MVARSGFVGFLPGNGDIVCLPVGYLETLFLFAGRLHGKFCFKGLAAWKDCCFVLVSWL